MPFVFNSGLSCPGCAWDLGLRVLGLEALNRAGPVFYKNEGLAFSMIGGFHYPPPKKKNKTKKEKQLTYFYILNLHMYSESFQEVSDRRSFRKLLKSLTS